MSRMKITGRLPHKKAGKTYAVQVLVERTGRRGVWLGRVSTGSNGWARIGAGEVTGKDEQALRIAACSAFNIAFRAADIHELGIE